MGPMTGEVRVALAYGRTPFVSKRITRRDGAQQQILFNTTRVFKRQPGIARKQLRRIAIAKVEQEV
jgi:hypothetical protein